uniref:Macaca fascicularis brain cDNA clone: QflA-17846, similar to human B-cell receptor-associated protein 29 (BCAP29), mRNA, RefSeq: NM_018844.1 n=1 Tax=Macaca fascicularis TaxID=9541 RepID=Q25JN0_MACFA|nr:unnamed protein product [Macaca fascicularis]BAE89428.1 unnamed protein product [Macaca fascicularis]
MLFFHSNIHLEFPLEDGSDYNINMISVVPVFRHEIIFLVS